MQCRQEITFYAIAVGESRLNKLGDTVSTFAVQVVRKARWKKVYASNGG